MYPHRIRLQAPWQHEALSPGRGRSSRRFGYPGRIDTYERVWLTLAGVVGLAEVSVNGTPLGPVEGNHEFEITSLLRPRNKLILVGPADAGGVGFSAVALEVRATAFLRRVRIVRQQDEYVATGEVVGHADGPLDLYLILDRSSAAYATVVATESGEAFRLSGVIENTADESPRVAKIELVQGAVKWYTVEVDLHEEAAQGPSA